MLISAFLDSLYEKTLRLGRSRFWLFFLGLVLLAVTFINGIGILPEEPYRRLAENPFITRTDIHFNNYWQENPLLPLLAHYLRLTTPKAFNILCFALLAAAFLLFALLASRRWGPARALVFSTLLITSPLTTVILTWLGTPDGLALLLTVPFLFAGSSPLFFFLAVLGAANHPAFMIAVLEILALRWAAGDRIGFKHLLVTGAGLAAGYGLVRWFLAVNQIEIVSRVDFMMFKGFMEWVKMNVLNLPMSVASLFNVHWLILVICLVMFFKRNRFFYALVLVFLLLNSAFTVFTLDTTRIFALLSWGVLFECLFHSYDLANAEKDSNPQVERQFLQSLIAVSIVSLFAPRYFSWLGEIHTTPFYQFLRKVFR